MSPTAVLAALKMGVEGAGAVAQGANAVAETAASLNSAKESLTQLFDRGPVADSGGDKMLASALSYFEQKQQQRDAEQEKMFNEKHSSVNLGPVGIEMKLQHEKGYLDLGKQNSQKIENEKIISLKYVKLDPITDKMFVQAESFKMEEVTSRFKKSQEGGKWSKVEETHILIQPALDLS